MRLEILTGAMLAAAFALPASADGYETSYATTSTYSQSGSTGYVTAPAQSACCCCARRVHTTTYVSEPVVTNRYTRTYTRLAAPDCYHTTHSGHEHTAYSYSSDAVGQIGYAAQDKYYDEGDYDDHYYDDVYDAPAPSYGVAIHADREDPWAHYDHGWKR